ncbi:PREDICTED: epoxide hydrolase 4-like [Nicrophorus vespilloides]|uniref:Epoxide hydrolase 4-like n=1 Tax=Nicrophorus vespilloides TaxID=110193 RepID=A0ABM1NFX1_NICVS|nr:PREDICTED: epoxide hydrolase 4-like [Nicrophorus vespilloides]
MGSLGGGAMVTRGGSVGCIESISWIDALQIHTVAVIFGLWIVVKRFAKWLWNPNAFFSLEMRDNPPNCLVDSSLGQHKYVKLKGIKFHYVEAGSKDRPLVLLLHGFPDCWLSWRYQIPALAEHFRVVALDLKGFGDSDKPIWRRSYRIDIILEELKQFILTLGVSRCIVIGHDLGGLLGWYLVNQEPELVDKFIAVGCPHPNIYWKNISSHSYFNNHWINFMQWPYLPEIDALKEDIKLISEYHKHLEENGNKDTYMEAYKYTFSRKEDWTGPINYYRNLPFIRISERMEPVKQSTFLITGNKGQYVKLEGVVQSTDYCEKFFVKIMDGSGQFPHQDNPDMFNRIILKFLRVNVERTQVQRSPSKGLMDRMFGAVSTTVKYGNSVLDTVQKKTNINLEHCKI